eukprot:tig00000789_g4108.t1
MSQDDWVLTASQEAHLQAIEKRASERGPRSTTTGNVENQDPNAQPLDLQEALPSQDALYECRELAKECHAENVAPDDDDVWTSQAERQLQLVERQHQYRHRDSACQEPPRKLQRVCEDQAYAQGRSFLQLQQCFAQQDGFPEEQEEPDWRFTSFDPPEPPPQEEPQPICTDFSAVCGSFLHPAAIDLYLKRGVRKLYEWQAECLSQKYAAVVRGEKNFLYSLPTSGGKSLVSEVLLIKTCVQDRKKAMMILPYISIVSEKTQHLEEFGSALGFQVESFCGTQGSLPLPPGNQLIVATIEKANIIVNHLIADETLDDLGLIVIDELHMLGEDPQRGYILELMISKLLLLRRKWERAGCPDTVPPEPRPRRPEGEFPTEPLRLMRPPQIVGMSATLPNMEDLSRWIEGDLFLSTFRPVPLQEFIKIEGRILDREGNEVRTVKKSAPDDADALLTLTTELGPAASVLVFCATKKTCEKLAEKLARGMPVGHREHRRDERAAVVQELRALGAPDPTLLATIPAGVAFHHAGITADERDLVEEAYRRRVINVLAATSTLAAGVNLPARRVILRSPYCGIEPLSASRYKQMCGRAGRAGIDDFGESILVVPAGNGRAREVAMRLINEPQPPLNSNLAASCLALPAGAPSSAPKPAPAASSSAAKAGPGGARPSIGFRRLLLEALCTRLIDTEEDMATLAQSTLYAQQDAAGVAALLAESRAFLLKHRLVEFSGPDPLGQSRARPTRLGVATFRSGMDPDDALLVHRELECLVLTDELQLCYLLTPVSGAPEPQWPLLYALYRRLPAHRQRVAQAMGVEEAYLGLREMGRPASAELEARAGLAARRFFSALILDEAIGEQSVAAVAAKYRVERGQVQALMNSAALFAATVVQFCKRMEYWALELIMSNYVQRLNFGVKRDVLPLVEIPGVKAKRARMLYRAGYRSVKAVASADPAYLAERCRGGLGPQADGVARMIVENAQKLMRRKSAELARMSQECLAAEQPVEAAPDPGPPQF